MKNQSFEESLMMQVSLAILSIFSIILLSIDIFLTLSPTITQTIQIIDFFICIIFLADFTIELSRADNKLAYLKWGWIDLLSSIPMLDYFRYGRLVRVIRLIKLLRILRSAKLLSKIILHNRKKNTAIAAFSLAIILLFTGALAILMVESSIPGANITNTQDAIWWAFVTITTVGYGDYYPITTEGRIVAMVLMIGGVGLFGLFTGFVASWFLSER